MEGARANDHSRHVSCCAGAAPAVVVAHLYNVSQKMNASCAICGCQLHREGGYAAPSAHGRSHATKHHHVAERFFGRSKNRKKEVREGIFTSCPWDHEKREVVLCYECHEELIHNPVFLPQDIERFAALVRRRGLSEDQKSDDRSKIGGRIKLLREVIDAGLSSHAKKGEPVTPSRVVADL